MNNMIKKSKLKSTSKSIDELVEASKKYIASRVLNKFYNLPIEIEDLESIIYQGVQKALKSYDENRQTSKASLTSWAIVYSKNECMNYIRKFISKRSEFNNDVIPFSRIDSYKIDLSLSDDEHDVWKVEFRYFIENDLSDVENEIASLIGQGYNKREVCEEMKISYHKLQEYISNIRDKFTKTE